MKQTVTAIILMFFAAGAWARPQVVQPAEADSAYAFFDHFFIGLSGGSQLLFSEDVENLDLADRFTPSFALSAGTWISPVWGLQISLQGNSLNGFSTTEGTYTATTGANAAFDEDPVRNEVVINPDGTYRHFIRYANLSLDVCLSLVNLFSKEKRTPAFDLIPSVGVGNMHVFNYKGIPAKNSFSANGGLTGKFYVSPRIDIDAHARAVFFENDFEGRIAGTKTYEHYISAGLGLVFYLGAGN